MSMHIWGTCFLFLGNTLIHNNADYTHDTFLCMWRMKVQVHKESKVHLEIYVNEIACYCTVAFSLHFFTNKYLRLLFIKWSIHISSIWLVVQLTKFIFTNGQKHCYFRKIHGHTLTTFLGNLTSIIICICTWWELQNPPDLKTKYLDTNVDCSSFFFCYPGLLTVLGLDIIEDFVMSGYYWLLEYLYLVRTCTCTLYRYSTVQYILFSYELQFCCYRILWKWLPAYILSFLIF